MVDVTHKGSFKKTIDWMSRVSKTSPKSIMEKYGRAGVIQLSLATPYDSGKTAESWEYAIDKTRSGYTLRWFNTNRVDGVPVVILLQYGHGTKNGGYVQGRDFINGPTKTLFEKMAEDLWKEVRR